MELVRNPSKKKQTPQIPEPNLVYHSILYYILVSLWYSIVYYYGTLQERVLVGPGRHARLENGGPIGRVRVGQGEVRSALRLEPEKT